MHTRGATWLAATLPLLSLACGGSDPSPGETSTGASTDVTTSATGSGSGGSGAGSGGSGSGATGSGGAPSFEGYTRVDAGSGTAVPGGADVAVAPDGTVYVSWVDEQNGMRDVFVARSEDGGATFGQAVKVDDAATEPLVSMARHPYVAADDARVAIVFNDEGGTVHLYVSPASDPPAFAAPVLLGSDVPTMFRDFPKALFLQDGNLLVAWQGYPDTGAKIFLSRETAGFASEQASGGAPGKPCECCPLDIVQAKGGDVMTAFRNNDNNQREMWLADAPSGGAFSSWVALSTSEGMLDSCPMQGPRLAQTGASSHVAVWSTRGSANTGAVHLALSTDGGKSWSGGAPIAGFMGDEPTVAVGASGRVWVTGVTGSGKSSLAWSDDSGASFTQPEPLEAPDGALATPQAEGGAGIAALAGVSKAGTVWLRRME